MDGLRPVRADNLAAFERLGQQGVRPTPRQEPTPPTQLGPAAELVRESDPMSFDPSAHHEYTLVHVLMLGEKVGDVAPRQQRSAPPEPVAAPPTPPPSAPSGLPAGGERITVSVETQRIEVEVQQGGEFARVEVELQSIQVRREPMQKSDPLILDLDGDGVQVTSLDDGVRFDLTGDGVVEQMATTAGGDGFLALDRDGDGAITSGRELFGDQHGSTNGFAELARFDDNQDRVIDAQDRVFEQLRIWRDTNHDGQSAISELSTLAEAGVQAINLDYEETSRDLNGSELAQKGTYRRSDGSTGEASDVLLSYRA